MDSRKKPYKEKTAFNNSMLPGNPQGLPDESFLFQKMCKISDNHMQVPAMAPWGNAKPSIFKRSK